MNKEMLQDWRKLVWQHLLFLLRRKWTVCNIYYRMCNKITRK